MSTLKKAKVIMLLTNEPSKIGNLATYQKRSLAKVIKEGINPKDSTVQFWNLYITSDDEIKEGDVVKIPCGVGKVKKLNWKFGNDNPSYIVEDIFIYKLRYGQKEGELQINSFKYEDVKKIIATTDTSLYREESCTGYTETRSRTFYSKKPLPKPSKQFIEKYIEEYNKGEIITNVLVEYEEWCNCNGSIKMRKHLRTTKCDKCIEWEELKINPKDNSLNICFID